MAQSKEEDAGGLTPAKDDNATFASVWDIFLFISLVGFFVQFIT